MPIFFFVFLFLLRPVFFCFFVFFFIFFLVRETYTAAGLNMEIRPGEDTNRQTISTSSVTFMLIAFFSATYD